MVDEPEEDAGGAQERQDAVETPAGRNAGKRKSIFKKLIMAIVLIWLVAWATNKGYPFWPGIAGVLTIPILLVALVVDNIYKE